MHVAYLATGVIKGAVRCPADAERATEKDAHVLLRLARVVQVVVREAGSSVVGTEATHVGQHRQGRLRWRRDPTQRYVTVAAHLLGHLACGNVVVDRVALGGGSVSLLSNASCQNRRCTSATETAVRRPCSRRQRRARIERTNTKGLGCQLCMRDNECVADSRARERRPRCVVHLFLLVVTSKRRRTKRRRRRVEQALHPHTQVRRKSVGSLVRWFVGWADAPPSYESCRDSHKRRPTLRRLDRAARQLR